MHRTGIDMHDAQKDDKTAAGEKVTLTRSWFPGLRPSHVMHAL